jgi:predicted Zn-ribbon and HTH transcriptional regulator
MNTQTKSLQIDDQLVETLREKIIRVLENREMELNREQIFDRVKNDFNELDPEYLFYNFRQALSSLRRDGITILILGKGGYIGLA